MKFRKTREIRYLREHFPQKHIFFEKSHKINTFWETNSIENVWVTFYRRWVFKTFLAQLRDFWLEFILTQSRLKIRLDIAPKSRKSFFEKWILIISVSFDEKMNSFFKRWQSRPNEKIVLFPEKREKEITLRNIF